MISSSSQPALRRSVCVCCLRTVEDGIVLKAKAVDVKNVAIIGGFIGLALAEQFTLRGANMHVFETMPRLLPFLAPEFSDLVLKTLTDHTLTPPAYVALGTAANKQRRVAGSNLSGVLRSMVTKIFDYRIAVTGLNAQQAEQAGFTSPAPSSRTSYYPDGASA